MPPKKRSQRKSTVVADRPTRAKRAKTIRPSELREVAPAGDSATPSHSQTPGQTGQPPIPQAGSVDVSTLTNTISAAVSQAIQSALSADNLAAVLKNTGPGNNSVVNLVEDEVSAITQDTNLAGIGDVPTHAGVDYPQPRQIFTSISVGLPSRVSSKLKSKIWANEYVDFGALLFSSPQHDGKYSLFMTPSGGSRTPHLSLEPSHSHKKIVSIQQWVSAFNIFVSIYAERHASDTPRLMKYCEVVRDLAVKSGDWFWYDEQFRYIGQSNPELYPWDQIHWELWLRAANSFRKQQPFTNKFPTQPRQRFRQPFFPKGTCWAFQAGKRCSGCHYEHSCFKCGAQHPGSQCNAQTTANRFGNKGKGGGAVTPGSTQPTGNSGKGGSS